MKMFSLLFICVFLGLVLTGYSQVITVTPPLPTDQNSVEVIFDASLGSAGLKDYTGDIYAHTGVLTNLSTSPSDWKYVKAGWSENIPACKLSSSGNNKWKLVIEPSIRSYYNVPTGEVIQKLAFVFRNADGSKTGKTEAGGDIFYAVYPSTLSVSITNPTEKFIFVDLNQSIPVTVSSMFADSTLLYVNGKKVAATNTNQISTSITASEYGQSLVKAIAKNATAMVADSFYFYVRPAVTIAELPAGMKDGINYLSETSVLLSLYAPLKQFAYAIGDFNSWKIPDESTYMKRTPDEKRYWLQIDGLVPGKEYIYQYLVDGTIRIGDPYASKVSDPWNDQYILAETYPGLIPYPTGKTQGIATVFQTAQKPYIWSTKAFTPPKKTDLVIYELLVRDFTNEHTFQSIIDSLGYLHKLGINAIELMPVSEFEGNSSWGYNPNYYFAVDKYYGPANKLKQLIDTCHQLGIAVIGDMVLNHSYGTSPLAMLYWDRSNSRPAANNPWYNVTAPSGSYSWVNDVNHERADTKKLVDSITSYWMSEFHYDGFRFDYTKGFTNTPGEGWAYDGARISIIKRMATEIWKKKPEAYVILEHWTDNSEEKELANFGCMPWGNMNNNSTGNYCEAAMGYISTSDLTWGAYTSRSWSTPNLVTYMESHDEERQMYKCLKWGNASGSYSTKDTVTALQRAALAATFFYTIPGPKMIWQFGELGYDYSIFYPSGTDKTKTDPKPIRWDYLQNANRNKLYNQVAALVKLKKENPVFETTNFTLSLAGAMKKIRLRNDTLAMVVLGNFDVNEGTIIPDFYQTGTWYEFFTGDTLNVTNVTANIALKAGEYRIYSNKKLDFLYNIGEQQSNQTTVTVIPNPVNERCDIVIKHDGNANCKAAIYDMNGKLVQTLFIGTITNNLVLQWNPLSKGIFVLKVCTNNAVTSRKIVATH